MRRKAASAAAVEAEKREADILVLDQIAEEEDAAAMKIQAIARGRAGRKIAAQKREAIARGEIANDASTKIQVRVGPAMTRVARSVTLSSCVCVCVCPRARMLPVPQAVFRGKKARVRVSRAKAAQQESLATEANAVAIQKVFRGHKARAGVQKKK